MKLLCLNTWCGEAFDQLIPFVKEISLDIDIFCFQEVYNSTQIRDPMVWSGRSNLLSELTKVLPGFKGYYAPTMSNFSRVSVIDFDLEMGLAIFVRKSIRALSHGSFFVYRNRFELFDKKFIRMPRNLQYLTFTKEGEKYLICNFHGRSKPGSKLDTKLRMDQSRKIKQFLKKREGLKILCGDFNLLPQTKSIRILEKDMRNLIKDYNITSTRSHKLTADKLDYGFQPYADYIFVSPQVKVKNFEVLSKDDVSDHLPLLLEFE